MRNTNKFNPTAAGCVIDKLTYCMSHSGFHVTLGTSETQVQIEVPDQNGISQACYIVEIYHPGPEPSEYCVNVTECFVSVAVIPSAVLESVFHCIGLKFLCETTTEERQMPNSLNSQHGGRPSDVQFPRQTFFSATQDWVNRCREVGSCREESGSPSYLLFPVKGRPVLSGSVFSIKKGLV